MLTGGCHCGAIRYEVEGAPIHAALCHCTDCRRQAGAPMVSWTLFDNDHFRLTQGEAVVYASSEHGRRHFCAACGTGLFYTNDQIFPNRTDVQSSTLDAPEALPPTAQIQVAERIGWMAEIDRLPAFQRYPGMD
jgi:hypothetical protein